MLVENGMHFARVAAFNFSTSGFLSRSASLDVLRSWKASKWAFPKTCSVRPTYAAYYRDPRILPATIESPGVGSAPSSFRSDPMRHLDLGFRV